MSRKNKFTIRISNDSFQCLVKHLQVSYSLLLWKIVHLFGILVLVCIIGLHSETNLILRKTEFLLLLLSL